MSKTVVITGAASGVGAATTRLVAETGAKVIALDIKPGALAECIRCDLGDPASIDQAVSQMPSRIDSLIHCAAVPGPTPADLVMRVNFLGLRHLTDALVPKLNDHGSVVSVASIAGRDWQRRGEIVKGLLDTGDFRSGLAWCESNSARWAKDPYTFSKQCVLAHMLRCAGSQLARGVRFNTISPGGIDTPMTPDFRRQVGPEQFDWAVKQIGRQARPEEIAEVIVFAAVGRCGWLNGADIIVDGGFVAGLAGGWIDVSTSPAAKARLAKEQS